MQNINELTQYMLGVVQDIRLGKLDPRAAKELNNAAGKAMGTVRLQLDYAKLRKEKPEIPFLSAKP